MTIRLRTFASLTPLFAVACGVFGADDLPPAEAEPDRSAENAVPPVSGAVTAGVFVSSSRGNDESGTGNEDSPVKTLTKAIQLAKTRQVRVLACAEEYREVLTLEDGISIYADFDCNQQPWTRTQAARAKLVAPSNPAVVAQKIAKPTRVEALDVAAPDGAEKQLAGGSSVGAWIVDSTNLTLARMTIRSAAGVGGADGAEPAPSAQTATGDAAGGAASGQFPCSNGMLVNTTCDKIKVHQGALGGQRTCAVGPQPGRGGDGGDGRVYNNRVKVNDPNVLGGDGLSEAGRPYAATAETEIGGVSDGKAGKGGANGKDGASGASGTWSITASGFVAGDGGAGQIGGAGQGGGGGSGREEWCYDGPNACAAPPNDALHPVQLASNGAGGGAGGCAGVPGTPGTGGGASIALLAWKSPISLDGVKLEAGSGGRAGKGTLGLAGQAGGAAGTASLQTFGGAPGGRGGHPGLGGHGAPGPSIALAFVDGLGPIRNAVELVPGLAGEGQPALVRDTQNLPAVAGQALAEYAIKP